MRNRKQSRFLLDRVEGEDIISRISKFIDKVISEDEAFKEIDRTKILKELSGMIGNLTDKQIETFDEAVKRRNLF